MSKLTQNLARPINPTIQSGILKKGRSVDTRIETSFAPSVLVFASCQKVAKFERVEEPKHSLQEQKRGCSSARCSKQLRLLSDEHTIANTGKHFTIQMGYQLLNIYICYCVGTHRAASAGHSETKKDVLDSHIIIGIAQTRYLLPCFRGR